MERRPISQSIREWLQDEMEIWRAGGVLSDDQPARILDLYETSAEAAGRRQSLAVSALSGIAAVMVGLAALLVVSYNWQDMSAALKLAIIFGVLIGSYLVASFLRLRTSKRLVSEVVFFLAGVFYGAAIWLIAQVFHIQSHYPDGIWFWAVGILPIVLYLDVLLLHAFYAFLLALWVGTEILGIHDAGRWFFVGGWAWPREAFTLPLLALPGLIWAYRKQSATTIGIYAPLLAWWGVLQPIAWHWEVDPVYFVGLAGALLLLIAEMHRVGSRLAQPYRVYGVLITAGVLVPLSYADMIRHLLRHGAAADNYVAGLVVALIGAVAALVVVLLQQRSGLGAKKQFIALVGRQWLPLCLVLLLAGLCFWSGAFNAHGAPYDWGYSRSASNLRNWTPQVLVPMAIVNVMMIVLALWLMRVGLREDRSGPFAAGVLYFLLWAVLRYVDLFSGVGGMLGAAVMFLLCGIGLFAVARFWMHRKETLPLPASGRGTGGEQSLPSPIGRGAGGEGGEPLHLDNTSSTSDALTLTLSQRERGHAKAFLLTGLPLQLFVLVGMIVLKAAPLWTGETVLLRVVPVDPRDMFRGDYVALQYEISRVPTKGELAALGPLTDDRRRDWQGRTVYVTLVPEEDGKHWRAERYSLERPTGGLFIRGTIVDWGRIKYGIESYYVQEGEGRQYEEAVRQRKISAEVAIAPNGQAALRSLKLESPLPSVGPKYENASVSRWPTDTTYRAVYLPKVNVKIDGRLDEPEWSRANIERHFVFPWKKSDSPPTEFMAFRDDEYLCFAFRVEDSDIVARDKLRDKKDVASEDRVEVFLSRDSQMKDYFCLEIDSRGRVHDYRASYYRQFDHKWTCKGLDTAGTAFDKGYVVEGRIPLTTLAEMGFPHLKAGDNIRDKILCGLYRAEFSHDRSGKPNGPPIEEWISWIDPKTPEPDFHVPSSLGWLEIVE